MAVSPADRETVDCAQGPCCHGDHHGWDCPVSDPHGDILRVLMDPMANPILENSRRSMLAFWGVTVDPGASLGPVEPSPPAEPS